MRKADNLPPSCAIVMKSGNLKFQEPSGPLQAFNGTALPFNITTHVLLLLFDTVVLSDDGRIRPETCMNLCVVKYYDFDNTVCIRLFEM